MQACKVQQRFKACGGDIYGCVGKLHGCDTAFYINILKNTSLEIEMRQS